MLLYHESGIAYTTNWEWVDNGEYPIISFGKFVFNDRFHVSRNGVKLKEGKDYIRVLRSKDVYMKFGVEMFGGIVLLSPASVTLDIYAVDSCLLEESLPVSTINPNEIAVYSNTNPMDGSYQDVVNMIDELEKLMPYIQGVTLPIYVFMTLGRHIPTISLPIEFSMRFTPIGMDYTGDTGSKEFKTSARSDFLGIDALPLDAEYLEYNTDPYPYNHGNQRVGISPLNVHPLGVSYQSTSHIWR